MDMFQNLSTSDDDFGEICAKLSHYHNFVLDVPIKDTCRSIEHKVIGVRLSAVVIVLHLRPARCSMW
jgi:hypothetical protein